jgi:hypothetical protein
MLYKIVSVLAAATALLLINCQPSSQKADLRSADSTAKTASSTTSTTTVSTDSVVATQPVSGTLSPLDSLGLIGPKITGPILPGKRIVAYYGNPHSKKMGALGEYPKDDMLRRLDEAAKNWEQGDTTGLKVQTALHLVATSAQGAPGKDGYYRMRMSDKTIRKVIKWAAEHNSICFLDIQVGLAPLQPELDYMEKYLKLPYVHLGIDPEFSMKTGARPGTRIGTYDAADVNKAIQFLSRIKQENNLPPKILVVHRFTQRMVTNYKSIKLDPNVQVVMHMDGWGPPSLKMDSYRDYIVKEPVQYTGFKLFYKNDLKKVDPRSNHKSPHLMTPTEVLALTPRPLYIQYQ